MIIVNVDKIPGKEFIVLGVVQGNMVKTKHFGKDMWAGFKTLVGGELKGYTKMMGEAREKATSRMIEEAKAMGADAIVNVRYSTSAIVQKAAEVMVYGTAVKFK